MPEIKGLLFDKDGTVLDFYRTWVPINRDMAREAAGGDPETMRALLAAGGHDPDTDVIAPGAVLAAGAIEAVAHCFAGVLGARTPPDLLALVARHFRDGGARHAIAIEGAAEHIAALAAEGYRIGLATNDTEEGLAASLGRHEGLIELFEFRAGCDSGHGAKPGPGMGLAFAEATGLAPSACAVIGDSSHDLEMGRRAGFGLCVGVLTGPSFRETLEPHADHVLDSIHGLGALLARDRAARGGEGG